MNTFPIDIVREILSYRGSDYYEALHHEITTQKKPTKKWLDSILNRIVDADQNDLIAHKEYLMLSHLYFEIDKKKNPHKYGMRV